MTLKDNVVIIDADFILYYATMGNKVFNESGEALRENNKFVYTAKTLDEVTSTTDSIINNMLGIAHADYYVGYLGDSRCFRYDIDSEYKANRKGLVKPMWFSELKVYLAYQWGFVLLDNGLEADDAVNIARNQLKDKYNIFIVTTDKDLIKCIPGKYINARDCAIIRTTKEKAREAFWTSMIVGDSIDGIKGIKGAGKKTAEKLFKDQDPKDYEQIVLDAYVTKYKRDKGITEYSKNYRLLHILDYYDGFEVALTKVRKEEVIDSSSDNCDRSDADWTTW